MPRLRKAEEYLGKIYQYADAVDIRIEVKASADDGVYLPARRKIVIDKDLDPSEEVAILLHELGHALDDALAKKSMEKRVDSAYKAIYAKKPTRKQRDFVMGCELRAWEYGRGIAKKLRIPLGKWYDRVRDESLKSYRETETQNR